MAFWDFVSRFPRYICYWIQCKKALSRRGSPGLWIAFESKLIKDTNVGLFLFIARACLAQCLFSCYGERTHKKVLVRWNPVSLLRSFGRGTRGNW